MFFLFSYSITFVIKYVAKVKDTYKSSKKIARKPSDTAFSITADYQQLANLSDNANLTQKEGWM